LLHSTTIEQMEKSTFRVGQERVFQQQQGGPEGAERKRRTLGQTGTLRGKKSSVTSASLLDTRKKKKKSEKGGRGAKTKEASRKDQDSTGRGRR